MNQHCDRARELVVAAKTGPRRPDNEAWLADHLGHCAVCAAYAEVMTACADEGDARGESAVPDALAAAVWPRLAASLPVAAPVRPGRRFRWVPALAAALALTMLSSGWLVTENRRLRGQLDAAVPMPAQASIVAADGLTTGELAARLRRLAPETPVLTRGEAMALLRRDRPLAFTLVHGARLEAAFADGVTAAEALQLLERLGPEVRIGSGGPAGRRS